MPAPCTPGTSFYADKRKQNPPGRPRSPYRCATMGTLGKSLVGVLAHLRLIHASSERFFRWRGCPRGAAKGLFFLVAHPGAGGVLRGEAHPRLERKIFPLARMPSRGCKRSIFLGSPPRSRGSFEGGRTSPIPRAVRPPLNVLFESTTQLGKGFFHTKTLARVWGRVPPQANLKMES